MASRSGVRLGNGRGSNTADLVTQGLLTRVQRGHDEETVRGHVNAMGERPPALCLALTDRAVAATDDIDALAVNE